MYFGAEETVFCWPLRRVLYQYIRSGSLHSSLGEAPIYLLLMLLLTSFQKLADFLKNRGKAANPAWMPGKLQLQITEAQRKIPSQ